MVKLHKDNFNISRSASGVDRKDFDDFNVTKNKASKTKSENVMTNIASVSLSPEFQDNVSISNKRYSVELNIPVEKSSKEDNLEIEQSSEVKEKNSFDYSDGDVNHSSPLNKENETDLDKIFVESLHPADRKTHKESGKGESLASRLSKAKALIITDTTESVTRKPPEYSVARVHSSAEVSKEAISIYLPPRYFVTHVEVPDKQASEAKQRFDGIENRAQELHILPKSTSKSNIYYGEDQLERLINSESPIETFIKSLDQAGRITRNKQKQPPENNQEQYLQRQSLERQEQQADKNQVQPLQRQSLERQQQQEDKNQEQQFIMKSELNQNDKQKRIKTKLKETREQTRQSTPALTDANNFKLVGRFLGENYEFARANTKFSKNRDLNIQPKSLVKSNSQKNQDTPLKIEDNINSQKTIRWHARVVNSDKSLYDSSAEFQKMRSNLSGRKYAQSSRPGKRLSGKILDLEEKPLRQEKLTARSGEPLFRIDSFKSKKGSIDGGKSFSPSRKALLRSSEVATSVNKNYRLTHSDDGQRHKIFLQRPSSGFNPPSQTFIRGNIDDRRSNSRKYEFRVSPSVVIDEHRSSAGIRLNHSGENRRKTLAAQTLLRDIVRSLPMNVLEQLS